MMAFHSKASNVNLKETDQMAAPGQLNLVPIFHDFNDQDDIFNQSNDGDANVHHGMTLGKRGGSNKKGGTGLSDSGSESEREGGWDTQRFLKNNIASSDGDINLSSSRYGGNSDVEIQHHHGFDDLVDDEFGGSMDISFRSDQRRRSSVGVGRDGTPMGAGVTGLDDSIVGDDGAGRRRSLGSPDQGGGFGGDDFGGDDFSLSLWLCENHLRKLLRPAHIRVFH